MLVIIVSYFIFVSDTKKQHQAQILELESLVASSKDLLKQQTAKIKDQVDKLVMSDTIIEQLIVDNDQLTTKLINLKQHLWVKNVTCEQSLLYC